MIFTSIEFLFLFLPLVLAGYYALPGYAIQFALFIVSVSCLVMNTHNPFIYFNF